MRLLIAIVQDGQFSLYGGHKSKMERQIRRDEEAQFLELKLYFKGANPSINENLEFWKRFAEEKKCYGLLVALDYDRAVTEYMPLQTEEDFNSFVSLGKIEKKE